MFYINHQFNNNIVWTVCNAKEELIEKIESIKIMAWVDVSKFHISDCEIKKVLSISQKLDNWSFVFDAEWKPVFESIETEMLEEKGIIFEIDLINDKSISKKISDFLSSIQ